MTSFSRLLGLGSGFKTKVVEAAGIVDGASVLDLACGTGLTATLVKQRFPRCVVTGLDVDPNILKIAGRHGESGVSGVDLVCAPAEKTGLLQCPPFGLPYRHPSLEIGQWPAMRWPPRLDAAAGFGVHLGKLGGMPSLDMDRHDEA